jgi:hypothetical protein
MAFTARLKPCPSFKGLSAAWFDGESSLSGFYETAVECKDIALVFLLLGFFVFAVVFAVSFAGTTRTLRRIHLGLLYALEESRQGLGA